MDVSFTDLINPSSPRPQSQPNVADLPLVHNRHLWNNATRVQKSWLTFKNDEPTIETNTEFFPV